MDREIFNNAAVAFSFIQKETPDIINRIYKKTINKTIDKLDCELNCEKALMYLNYVNESVDDNFVNRNKISLFLNDNIDETNYGVIATFDREFKIFRTNCSIHSFFPKLIFVEKKYKNIIKNIYISNNYKEFPVTFKFIPYNYNFKIMNILN